MNRWTPDFPALLAHLQTSTGRVVDASSWVRDRLSLLRVLVSVISIALLGLALRVGKNLVYGTIAAVREFVVVGGLAVILLSLYLRSIVRRLVGDE